MRKPTEARDGVCDGLRALEPIDVAACTTIDALVRAMGDASFGARTVGAATDVAEAMIRDPECAVVLTVSGALTAAKLGPVLCEMIDRRWVHAVVTTGAVITHGMVEGIGRTHFRCEPGANPDGELYAAGYDRIYDSLELEGNLVAIGELTDEALAGFGAAQHYGSAELHRRLGELAADRFPSCRGLLQSAAKHGVPIYVPAFTDSEIGITVAIWNRHCKAVGRTPPMYDAFVDFEDFAQWVSTREKLGIVSLGGGVPRNWAQQVGPYTEWLANADVPIEPPATRPTGSRYTYAVRVCPEPAHFGGLSGSTYSEGETWGKFTSVDAGGRRAEVLADATIVWPLVVRALIERLR